MKSYSRICKLLFAFVSALLIVAGITSLIFLHFSDKHIYNYRRKHLISISKKIEKDLNLNKSIAVSEEYILKEFYQDSLHEDNIIPYPFSFLNNNSKQAAQRIIKPQNSKIWLVDQNGEILIPNDSIKYNFKWEEITIPKADHELISIKSWLKPSFFILKIKHKKNLYLILQEELPYFDLNYISLILAHSLLTTGIAMMLALIIVFVYLNTKSKVAAFVMSQLASGNLKARFEIDRFDDFTTLMLNFNRMADEIERLVVKLRSAETARTQMIQELGHDLKTPLTSMMTNTETLVTYFDNISQTDRQEVLSQLKSDVVYFKQLIENLTEMASLDEPSYKLNTSLIDLKYSLIEELKNRQSKTSLEWILDFNSKVATIQADPHLLNRLFKNALDNSSRFAKSQIKVNVATEINAFKISIMDDGPGLTSMELKLFAKRRERRKRHEGADEYSLGFGSIIMKSIVQLHGGSLRIFNLTLDNQIIGSCLEIILPFQPMAHKQEEKVNLLAQAN